MERIWERKDQGDRNTVEQLSHELKITKILSNLLVQRGVKTYDEAKAFFRPDMASLYNPFLMKNMDEAVNRLEKAIQDNEKILVYGDYDVDGTTSVALIYSFLTKIYKNVCFYIPDRYAEGYGISYKGIDYAAENKCSLIIALDCGIKAVEKVRYATEKNIDFIICDHHNPGEEIPDAVAVLDARQKDCNYPFKELSGCGVGFKLIQAYTMRNSIDKKSLCVKPDKELYEYLDLLAVSIASDIVPVIGENRIFAYHGIKKLRSNPRTGLQAIINVAHINQPNINISDVVFKIGPRINAAGRIESGKSAVEVLISESLDAAKKISHKIDQYNITRKNLDQSITDEALETIKKDDDLQKRHTTVIYNNKWHKGVIGIVASRLIETYYRPTIVLTESNGMITGSARSVNGFNLYDAIDTCSDLLEGYGGHCYAAGLTLKKENLNAFSNKFEEVVASTIQPEQLIPRIEIDATIDFRDIDKKFYRILKQFAPFGPGNMSPVFVTENVADYNGSRVVGLAEDHLKLELINNNVIINAIAFNQAKHIKAVKQTKSFSICYAIDQNIFNGRASLQLKVKDIKFTESEPDQNG